MNTQEFIEKIKTSEISDERKDQILMILEQDGDFSFETQEKIKDIIREDIQADVVDVLTEEDKTKISTATEEMFREYAVIDAEFSEDMALVESELNNLENAIGEADKALDQIEIENLKTDIENQA